MADLPNILTPEAAAAAYDVLLKGLERTDGRKFATAIFNAAIAKLIEQGNAKEGSAVVIHERNGEWYAGSGSIFGSDFLCIIIKVQND